MNPTTPHVEDILLDFAYGELSEEQARSVQAHLDACERCADALRDIQGVRRVMAKLPEQVASDAGLSSLFAYAEQAARRVQAGPPPKPVWWRRWMFPVGGLVTVAVAFVVAQTTLRETGTEVAELALRAEQKERPVAAVRSPSAPAMPTEAAVPSEAARALAAESAPSPAQSGAGAEVKGGAPQKQAVAKREAVVRREESLLRKSARSVEKKVAAAPPPSADQAGAAILPDTSAERSRSEAAPVAKPAAPLSAGGMPMAQRARAVASMDVAGEPEAAPMTEAEQLSRDAWAAYRDGDRGREATLLRRAVATGVRDPVLLSGLLNRLCDVEYALGNVTAGDAACQRVIRDFAGQSAAEVAKRRMQDRPGPTRPFDR